MIFAGIDVNIITHHKALEAGVEAFGLWCWGMCYAQLHETDGLLPRVAVLSALCGRRNIMVAKRLVEVGLWVANDDGSWSVWNYASKNQTAEEIRAKKAKAAERVKQWRSRSRNGPSNTDVTRNVPVTDSVTERVRTDPPPEPSPPPEPENKSIHTEPDVTAGVTGPIARTGIADPSAPPPDWWDGVLETIATGTGVALPASEAWLRYAGHRASKTRPADRRDAVHWLTTVMVREARDDREKARHQRDRDEKFDREREKQRDAAAAPQPYHRVAKLDAPAERPATEEERAEAMRKITGLFGVGRTGT